MKIKSNRVALLLLTGSFVAGLTFIISCASDATSPKWTDWSNKRLGATVTISGKEYSLATIPPEIRSAADEGCVSCHQNSRDPHPSLQIRCVDCHGGNPNGRTIEDAHPKPKHPERWPIASNEKRTESAKKALSSVADHGEMNWPSSANPERTYTLLNDESQEWIQFINPGDLRVTHVTCDRCHPAETLHVHKSLMNSAAHFWGTATYANGIVSNKKTIFGESYSPEGVAQKVNTVNDMTPEERAARSIVDFTVPLPHWEVTQPGNVFRVFEQGSRLGGAALGFNGFPVPLIGLPDKFEDPGRPNNRLSDRGLGTLNRVDLPTLNVFKTRLNDPMLSFLGTNDQPGDYRSSGCTACHMIYANDRNPIHSGPYAKFGNRGHGNAVTSLFGDQVKPDPMIPNDEPGHPIAHAFTTAIPSSQCIVCHHHQPNSFLNTYFGYIMWAYDADGEGMWPKEQQHPSHSEWFDRIDRNPEGAAVTGKWGDPEFLANVSDLNPELKHTQFADYHGHGWIFRGAFKTDRKGNLLDEKENIVKYDDPDKFKGVIPELGQDDPKPPFIQPTGHPVHLMDIHAERGMHCVDCHFQQDSHGNGNIYAEYQAAVEITCQDCHGTASETARLVTSGPAAREIRDPATNELKKVGTDLRGLGSAVQRRFRKEGTQVFQRSMVYPDVEWDVPQVLNTITKGNPDYNEKAAMAKTVKSSRPDCEYAHGQETMECYTCHTSWVTSCFGCHLPQKANWRSPNHHNETAKLRNLASYNPQVAGDSAFMLGVAGDVKGNKVSTVRSSSAVMISSEDAVRQKIYAQIPTIAGNGMSSQLFNTHFAHTVRTTETRSCDDCHVSNDNDNNAWLAQAFLLGTNYVNFMGYRVFVGEGSDGFEAVRVTEWEEPQAVIGSNLHKFAYPDHFQDHLDHDLELGDSESHGGSDIRSLQLRGEYLYTASGEGGFRVYDVANVNNKGFSEKIVTSPVSPLGQDTHISTTFATCVALPTNNHISMSRAYRKENRETEYTYDGRSQNMHETYRYAYVTDRSEGLIVVDIDCLTDFEPRNNFVERVATFNPGGSLNGAEYIEVAGTTAYICCTQGLVAIDIEDPRKPKVIATVGTEFLSKPTSVAVQFRYAFVTDSKGVHVVDITRPSAMKFIEGASLEVSDARHLYVARTYGYVAAGKQGLIIVDLENPEKLRLDQTYDAGGRINDLNHVKVASTNDSVFAYLADGHNGLHVLQIVTPGDGPRSAYGFAPRPVPELIATYSTNGPALALSKGLDRDRAADESGNQMAAFGRIGGRPLNLQERERLYMRKSKEFTVTKDGKIHYGGNVFDAQTWPPSND